MRRVWTGYLRRGRGGLPSTLLLTIFALGLNGCHRVGSSSRPGNPGPEEWSGEPSQPMPQGVFRGFLEIEGGRVEGSLTLTPRGGTDLDGSFDAPPDMVAVGQGRYRDGELRLELNYEGACPGKMTLIGRWQEGAGTLSGRVRASDCTGEAQGTFLFNP